MHRERIIEECLFFYSYRQKISDLIIDPKLLETPLQPELFPNYVKCKSEETRKILMEIIYNLYKSNKEQSTLDFFEKYILPILNELPENLKKPS
jgi:hypothetical protein